jgi:hypothetical protein
MGGHHRARRSTKRVRSTPRCILVGTFGGAVATIVMGTLVPRQVRADPEFGWSAPEGCPSKEDLAARIRRRAGAHRAEIEVRIGLAGGSYSVESLRVDGRARRGKTIRSERCATVVDAVVESIALSLAGGPGVRARPVGSQRATKEPEKSPEPADLSVALGGGAMVGARWSPEPVLGASTWLGLIGDGWRLDLLGELTPNASVRAPNGREGHFQLASAWAQGCGRLWQGPLEAWGCSGLALDAARGRGRGVARPREAQGAWFGVEVGALARAPLMDELFLTARAAGVLALHRPRYYIEETVLFRPHLLGFRGVVGAEVVF